MSRPVFFDPTGRRKKLSRRLRWGLGLLIAAALAAFAWTVLLVPVPRPLPLARSVEYKAWSGPAHGNLAARVKDWLPSHAAARHKQLRIGFYVPWDETSRESLHAHGAELDWVVPALGSVLGPQHAFRVTPDPQFDAMMAHGPAPKVVPMVQNTLDGDWDGANTARLLADPAARAKLIEQTLDLIHAKHGIGVTFDFEELPATSLRNYLQFIAEARRRLAHEHFIVSLAVPVDNPDWDLAAFGKAADKLFIMDYDEHYGNGEPGAIASQGWFVKKLAHAIAKVGADKVLVAIGAYGNDWATGKAAVSATLEEAWLTAKDSGARVRFDAASGNQTFDYEQNGVRHQVWMLDATSNWNQMRAARNEGVAGIAVWRLGSEDPAFWSAFAAFDGNRLPDLSEMKSIGDVDVQGSGEFLRITNEPVAGRRQIQFSKAGLINNETFQSLPTPYVVERAGAQNKKIALTFDDGPDATWTPRILDVLKARHVPAAFFVVGENAMLQPGLLNRIVNEGHELGNHSFTHPNLAGYGVEATNLELNSTQRLVEAYTGRAMRMFRAPYFGDAEPTTGDELRPALAAQNQGYVNVGLHVDPGDWKRPGAQEIVRQTLLQAGQVTPERSENIVLLHDGGGNRAQTLAALPALIDGLRARGFEIVPVSQLVGLTRDQTMPVISGGDLAAVRADTGLFLILAGAEYVLGYLFLAAIGLGTLRATVLAVLAWRGGRSDKRKVAPPIDPERFVSVIIPAFNEARVIEFSVARVLASEQVRLEVIVVDDGSKDGTGDVVEAAFGNDKRVRLLRLENGGKARALNQAMVMAKGEIIIALDADTQFEPLTIARLARWFVDPRLGAVAGNAMVGNKVNLVTRWQAIEYITAQNLERRALARFDAITVVPGAVGAWRRTALESVGFYPEDTLAEDQDLTIAVQRQGWKVTYDTEAVAWTEAPETFRALARQRYRWAFGTLQCLWKHRAILSEGNPRGLARIGLPQAWVFQIAFAVISPLIDLALVVSIFGTVFRVMAHGWVQTSGDVLTMAVYWLAFTGFDLTCGWIAYRLEPRTKGLPGVLLIAQRLVYRQLMYGVVIKALASAIHGPKVGWGKLERTGTVTSPATV